MTRNTISQDDRDAAEVLLTSGALPWTHIKVLGLKGADRCPHELAGNGEVIVGLLERLPGASLGQYALTPYRHHEYRNDHGDERWCRCGNSKGGLIHQRCWEGGAVIARVASFISAAGKEN